MSDIPLISGKEVGLQEKLDECIQPILDRYRYREADSFIKAEGLDSLISGLAQDLHNQGYRLIELSEEEKLRAWGN